MSQVSITWHSTWHPVNNEWLASHGHSIMYFIAGRPNQDNGGGNRIQNISSISDFSHHLWSKKCHLLPPLAFLWPLLIWIATPHSTFLPKIACQWSLVPHPLDIPYVHLESKKMKVVWVSPISWMLSLFPGPCPHPTPWEVKVPMLSALPRLDEAPHRTGSCMGSTYYAQLHLIAHVLPCNQFNFMLR